MPKPDPGVKTIAHAKEASLKKWHAIRKDLERILKDASQPCGFCNYQDDKGRCMDCPVFDKCQEQDVEVHLFLEGSLKYIEEDLIPYLEKFQLNGETA